VPKRTRRAWGEDMRHYGRQRLFAAIVAWVALLALAGVHSAGAQEGVYDTNRVKAEFLYHFGTYIQWPADLIEGDAMRIAVLGAQPVVDQLARFLPGRSIQGRRVEVVPLERIDELGDAEVLFVGSEHNASLESVLAAVGRRPCLTVTDAEDGLERGAMVNFQLLDERVRFEVSLRRAEDVGLIVSSRLLSTALRVETS
jgi:hypothetical protein